MAALKHKGEGEKLKRRPYPLLAGATPGERNESEVRWLISYSDFMMQLVCLFILLYSVSSTDARKAGEIAQAWREQVGLEPLRTESNPVGAVHPPVGSADLAPFVREIELAAGRMAEGKHFRVHPLSTGFRLQLGHGMFEEGSGRLTRAGERLLDLAASLVAPIQGRATSIELVGHTAAGDAEREEGSALRLSLSRSREALAWLTRRDAPHPLAPGKLEAAGRGPHEPLADPGDPDRRALNRRVEIAVRLVP